MPTRTAVALLLAGLVASALSVLATISILIPARTSGSDLFAQPPGSVLWRTSASQLLGEPLAEPLDVALAQTPGQGGRVAGGKTHRNETSGDRAPIPRRDMVASRREERE